MRDNISTFQITVGLIEMLKELRLALLVCFTAMLQESAYFKTNSSRNIYHQIQGTSTSHLVSIQQ
jgi:hypothetical protein